MLPTTESIEISVTTAIVNCIPNLDNATYLLTITINTNAIVIGYRNKSIGTENWITLCNPTFAIANPTTVNNVAYVLYESCGNFLLKNSEVATINPTVVVKHVRITIIPKNILPKLPNN